MIVQSQADGSVLLISQNDHAQAAATIAAHWGNAQFARPRQRSSMIRAAMLHDFSWIQEESAPPFDPLSGGCVHYTKVPGEEHIDSWANDWVAPMDRYAGLMVAKHRTGIWRARYGLFRKPHYAERAVPASAERVIGWSHADQAMWALEFDVAEIITNYMLLQVWDLFSLYICTTEILQPLEIDPVPVGYEGDPGVAMQLRGEGDRIVAIDPYPFDVPSLTVGIVHRRLAATHADEATFRAAYFATPQQMMNFKFVASSSNG